MKTDKREEKPIKLFLLCSGLGRTFRGFESFTQECSNALSQVPSLDLCLYKGGGQSRRKEVRLPSVNRTSGLALKLARLVNRDGYFVEQSTFTLSLLPHLITHSPDVIYFSDGNIGNMLWRFRRLTRARYKLLLSNGAPFIPPLFPRCDFVHQVAPSHLENCIAAGIPSERQAIVPYGIRMPSQNQNLSSSDRKLLRAKVELPEDRVIILSVGAVNTSHKRMDYLIREVAQLPSPRPFLVILGQTEAESPAVLRLANNLLGTENFLIRTVPSDQVGEYYRLADMFALCSLHEGFGRVFLEAMSFGLPCLAHDYEVARFSLGTEGFFGDFTIPGSLARLIDETLTSVNDRSAAIRRINTVREKFGWEALTGRYVEMITQCMSAPVLYQ